MPTSRRACATCSKAKSKCVARSNGGSCERCHRLNKRCVPVADAVVRPRTIGTPLTPKAAPLEEKLDRLVALLQNQQNARLDGTESPGQYINAATASSFGSASADQSDPAAVRTVNVSNFRLPGAGTILPCPGEPSPSQADEYLVIFRTHMLRFFPVIRLPPEMSSQQLRKEKPFLWLCIMSVACTSTSHQLILGDSIRQIVGRELVYRSEKNMDLLLGLLTFIAWAHYQLRYMAFLSDFMQLSMSLVFDLGLNKSAETPRGPISFRPATEGRPTQARPTTPSRKEKTMEERRAVLACFLLSSTLAATLKRLDGLRWTPSMDESLALLSERPECTEDTILTIQVKLQLLTNQLDRTHCTWPFGNSRYASDTQVPLACYLDALLTHIGNIKNEIPPELVYSDVIWGHFHCTFLILHEAFLSKSSHSFTNLDLERLERFTACMQSIKSWFEVFSTITPPSYVGFTFPYMCAMAYNLLTLARFSTIEDTAWDKSSVRKTVDILAICDTLVQNYGSVVATCRTFNEDDEMDFFSDCVKSFQCMGRLWKRDLDTLADPSGYEYRQENFEDISFGFATEWIDAPFMMNIPSSY